MSLPIRGFANLAHDTHLPYTLARLSDIVCGSEKVSGLYLFLQFFMTPMAHQLMVSHDDLISQGLGYTQLPTHIHFVTLYLNVFWPYVTPFLMGLSPLIPKPLTCLIIPRPISLQNFYRRDFFRGRQCGRGGPGTSRDTTLRGAESFGCGEGAGLPAAGARHSLR